MPLTFNSGGFGAAGTPAATSAYCRICGAGGAGVPERESIFTVLCALTLVLSAGFLQPMPNTGADSGRIILIRSATLARYSSSAENEVG